MTERHQTTFKFLIEPPNITMACLPLKLVFKSAFMVILNYREPMGLIVYTEYRTGYDIKSVPL